MQTIQVAFGYLRWHYGKAVASLSAIWKNFFIFLTEFFSLKLLFRNFFDPWKKMTDSYPAVFNLKKYFTAFLANLIMRLFGMVMRLALILIGLLTGLLFILLYPPVVLLWFVLPAIVIFFFTAGLFLMIK